MLTWRSHGKAVQGLNGVMIISFGKITSLVVNIALFIQGHLISVCRSPWCIYNMPTMRKLYKFLITVLSQKDNIKLKEIEK